MILYFSGTGNSRHVARRLATALDDRAIGMYSADAPSTVDREPLGLVFPVYSWGVPRVVERFLRTLTGCPTYIYMVCTCGDDIGRTDRLLEKLLAKKGWQLRAAFSIQMPNTYVAMPGFDVDDAPTVAKKLAAAESRIQAVAQRLKSQMESADESVLREVTAGRFPAVKSYVILPLYLHFSQGDRAFHVSDQCIGCGQCERHCPMSNIRLDAQQRPEWQGRCAECYACYHVCPTHAIGYGRFTKGKGQKKILP